MDKDDNIFKSTTFSDIMSDIYHNSKKKDRQISKLIEQLQPLIRNSSDATIIVPLIKEYMDVSVKNDDHLIKLAAIIQRYISTKQTIAGVDSFMSDEEKKQLLAIAEETYENELSDELKQIQQEEYDLNKTIAAAKDKLNDNRS
jgi:hypothetical protein